MNGDRLRRAAARSDVSVPLLVMLWVWLSAIPVVTWLWRSDILTHNEAKVVAIGVAVHVVAAAGGLYVVNCHDKKRLVRLQIDGLLAAFFVMIVTAATSTGSVMGTAEMGVGVVLTSALVAMCLSNSRK